MIEAFVELMDQLYYEGYTSLLESDDPERFNFELNEFLNNYGSGLRS
jgi:hypothetical protein